MEKAEGIIDVVKEAVLNNVAARCIYLFGSLGFRW